MKFEFSHLSLWEILVYRLVLRYEVLNYTLKFRPLTTNVSLFKVDENTELFNSFIQIKHLSLFVVIMKAYNEIRCEFWQVY